MNKEELHKFIEEKQEKTRYMAKFVIYTYKLHLTPDGMMGSLFTEEEILSPKEALEQKQDLFQKILDQDLSGERPFKCVRKQGKGVPFDKDYTSQILWTPSCK